VTIESVLFDLDGTVINSYPGIQSAFDIAYLHVYGQQNTSSIKSIIGPPIGEILVRLNNEHDKQRIEEFVEIFKTHYDSTEFKKSVLYEGIKEVLVTLKNTGLNPISPLIKGMLLPYLS
jgi:phosphoglycolate phosphatase